MGRDVNDNGLNGKEAIKVNLLLNKVLDKQAFCNFSAEISKTGPLHIHLLWGLRVFTSTDMVQPSPQLNCVAGGITFCTFHRWQSNPAPLTPQVYDHTVFQHLITIFALPELICSLTTWSSVAGMELQLPGCGTQVAAIPKYDIIFCALSSRSVVCHVFYCVVNFVVVG